MESRGHQTDITANHKYNKLDDILGSKISQMGKNRSIEGHKKVKEDEFDHNIDAPQKSIQNYEADEYEENGESRMIKMEKLECIDDILPDIAVEHYEPEESLENHTKVPQESVQNYESDQYEADEYEENCKSMVIKVEKFECSDDIIPDIVVEHYKPEQSINHTKVSVQLEHRCAELENLSESKNYQIEESKRNKWHNKVKVDKFGHNVEEPQESVQNYEPDQYEGNEENMIIKVEKFECSDDILPDIAVEHYEPEQSIERQTKVSVKFGLHRDKLSNASQASLIQPENCEESKEESKRNEGYSKIKVDKFRQNDEESQKYVQNYESDKYEGNEEKMIIKVEKFECSDDILPQIAVEHYEPEQSIENQNIVLIKVEHHCNKLSQTSQISQPEKYKGNQENKDCTTTVASAVYDVSDDSKSSTKTISKQGRRGGNLNENRNHKVLNKIDTFDNISDNYEDTIHSELSQDDDSISAIVETSKVLVTDSQCYVALDRLSYKCDLCRYVTVIKELLVSHMKLHNYKQSVSISECNLQFKNKIFSEKYEPKKNVYKLFACNLCSYRCAQKSSLQRHQLTHTGEKPFACNICSYKSARKSYLHIHHLTHTGEKPFACNLCSYKSADKSNLQRHQLTHTGGKLFACNICSYKSAQKSTLQRHQLTHTGETPFACNFCSYKSAQKSLLKSHHLTHTGEKPFACNICSYKSVHKSHLQTHQLTHTGEKPFACNLCSYKSAHKSDLKRHQLKHTGKKPFACNLCSYKSAQKSHLRRHQLTHTGEKPFACNICSYKSAHKLHLQTHQLTHTGEKPFACNLCSYKSFQNSDLQKHQRKHTGEKPFACNLCSYKSAQKSSLQRHQLSHTGEKPFACNLCSYKSAQKSSLQAHQFTHTGEKPFVCNLCSYKSFWKSHLKRHQLKHCSQ